VTITLRCKAILFDMDGTLVDSTAIVEGAWGWWAKRHGIPVGDVLQFSHGRPTLATMEHFLPGRDHTAELVEMSTFEETQVQGLVPVPGAIRTVQSVERGAWAVVTSAPRRLAEIRLQAAGFPVPEVLVPADEIERGKPDPQGFLRAARHLRIAANDCLVFEDTQPGLDAGVRAGMQSVALLTTFARDQLNAEWAVRDFNDVHVTWRGDDLLVEINSVQTHAALRASLNGEITS
jgi:mannitol-1-/sugar-/sorbitol-6-phosphatase